MMELSKPKSTQVCYVCNMRIDSKSWKRHQEKHIIKQGLMKLMALPQSKFEETVNLASNGTNFPSPARENSKSDQQTNFKQCYGYSTTGRDKCFNALSSDTHFEENKKSAQPNSFSTNYVTDWDKLSRTCSSMSQMSEAAKLLLQEKDGQLIELKERMHRLESRLETKDCELIQLRCQVGGLEVQSLKIELAVVKSQLLDRDASLKELKQKEKEWLNMFGQVYNLSKDPSFYKDLKKALEEFQGSLQNSKINSLRASCSNSRDNSEPIIQTDGDNQQMDEPQLVNMNTSQEVFETEEMPIYGFNCKVASNNADDKEEADIIDTTQKNYTHHKGEAYMQWSGPELIDVTSVKQAKNLINMNMEEFRYRCATCKKLFSCDAGWKSHAKWMNMCDRQCVCDVFYFGKYKHSLGGVTLSGPYERAMKPKELQKLETLIAITMKNPELVQPEKFKSVLETKRDIQREDCISFLKKNKDLLMQVEEWLATFAQQCEKSELKAFTVPICDAIVYPRCPLIFGDDINIHDERLAVHLKSYFIPVKLVGNVSNNDKTLAFVYLLDSDNKFTPELIENLNLSLDDLATKIKQQIPPSELREQRLKTELDNLYIRQTDYTKDFLGFFMLNSLFTEQRKQNKFDTLRQIGELIHMKFSESHSQLNTSIQFESFAGKLRQERLKVYNKWTHLLLTYSFKTKLSMGTSKLFKAPLSFYQKKLQPSFNEGLTRIELSSYFHSRDEWKQKALNVQYWEGKIASIQNALQSVQETLIYKVNFKVFWDSFWVSVNNATTFILFEPDLWTVVYAHSSRSYLYTGHHTDRHGKSGACLTFLQRFAGAKTLVRVKNGDKYVEFLIERHGGECRQIPIDSLNVIQHEVYRFPIDLNKWFYNLSKEQLNYIQFACDNQQEFDDWFGQDPALAGTGISQFYIDNQVDQFCCNDEGQLHNINEFYEGQLTGQVDKAQNKNKKKRDTKRSEKEDIKQLGQAKTKVEKYSCNGRTNKGTKIKKSYQGGGINITEEVAITHTKKGNVLCVQSQKNCQFKAEAGGSKFYSKYNCESHCGLTIEKYEGVYYLFQS